VHLLENIYSQTWVLSIGQIFVNLRFEIKKVTKRHIVIFQFAQMVSKIAKSGHFYFLPNGLGSYFCHTGSL
jgi:hypothetical protein